MDRAQAVACSALVAFALLLASPAAAAPMDQAAAQAVVEGWMADGQHLAVRFASRIRAVETFEGFYVFHLQPEGFIVTSADDEVEPILAFSDRGDFKHDLENPLSLLLGRHIPARLQQLEISRGNFATLSGVSALGLPTPGRDPVDETVLALGQAGKAKWERYLRRASTPLVSAASPASIQAVGAAPGPGVVDPADPSLPGVPPPIRITDIRIVDGHVRLTHDAPGSVTIYASYDGGEIWLPQDSGVVDPVWTSKTPVRESGCWYRIMADQIHDDMMVSLMRQPPPPLELPPGMTNSGVIAFGPTPGLSGGVATPSDIRVAPLVQSLWSQSAERGVNCYNYYTPNNYVDGCVATALAQLMRFWQYPIAGIGRVSRTIYVNGVSRSATTRGGDGSGGPYTWSAMPLSPTSAPYNLAHWQMIGSLCYDAGVSVSMQYSSGGSGAYMSACSSALTSVFKFANAKHITYPGNILTPTDSNLAAGCPVLFGISSSGRNGHAIVCDGFGYDAGTLYHHLNMGWDGAYNAWYALPTMETPYNFNSVDTIIYNAFPTGTGELLTGRVTTSQGAAVSGAAIVASSGGVSYSGSTDSKGYYGIKVPSAKTYSVTASKAGMAPVTRSGVIIGTSSTSAVGNVIGIDITLNNTFSFSAVGLTESVWLRWTAPLSSGMANNTVYIRHRTDRYPSSSSDGSLVYTGTAQVFQHTGVDVTGTVTNFYTIWGDNGSPYASLGSSVNACSVADPGRVRMFWTRSTGEIYAWNLKATGARKSGGYVISGLVDPKVYKLCGVNDIDGDGVSDLLWTRTTGEVVHWLLNADGTMRSYGSVVAGNGTRSGYFTVAGTGDINGDGTADILWIGAGGEVGYWFLNADGTRKSAGAIVAGNGTRSGYFSVVGFADINLDSIPDILWIGAGGEVGYWFLNADGTRKSAGATVPGNGTRSGYFNVVGFADIDRDQTADILWTGAGGEVGYWMLNADGTRKSAGAVIPGKMSPVTYWKVVGFKDVNGDGTADILWQGQAGESRCWMLKADGTFSSVVTIEPNAVLPTYWTERGTGVMGQ